MNCYENSDANDKIIVWGNWNIIYVQSDRLPASKYSYQFPVGNIDENIIKDFYNEINETVPKMVIIPQGSELGTMENFLNEHNYTNVYEIDGAVIFKVPDISSSHNP